MLKVIRIMCKYKDYSCNLILINDPNMILTDVETFMDMLEQVTYI
jgi:hypothetical protein